MSQPTGRPARAQALLGAATLACSLAFSGPAAAVGVEEPAVRPKGTVGGALLGAEAVTLATAAFGVESGWAYLLGGAVGAAGGAVGGYFLEDSLEPRGSMFILAAGMILVIPTTVVVLNATAYRPPEDYVQDQPPQSAAATSRPRQGRTAQRLHLKRPLPSLVGMDEGTWTVGVPAISLLDVYSPEMRRTYDLEQATELRVPVLAMRF